MTSPIYALVALLVVVSVAFFIMHRRQDSKEISSYIEGLSVEEFVHLLLHTASSVERDEAIAQVRASYSKASEQAPPLPDEVPQAATPATDDSPTADPTTSVRHSPRRRRSQSHSSGDTPSQESNIDTTLVDSTSDVLNDLTSTPSPAPLASEEVVVAPDVSAEPWPEHLIEASLSTKPTRASRAAARRLHRADMKEVRLEQKQVRLAARINKATKKAEKKTKRQADVSAPLGGLSRAPSRAEKRAIVASERFVAKQVRAAKKHPGLSVFSPSDLTDPLGVIEAPEPPAVLWPVPSSEPEAAAPSPEPPLILPEVPSEEQMLADAVLEAARAPVIKKLTRAERRAASIQQSATSSSDPDHADELTSKNPLQTRDLKKASREQARALKARTRAQAEALKADERHASLAAKEQDRQDRLASKEQKKATALAKKVDRQRLADLRAQEATAKKAFRAKRAAERKAAREQARRDKKTADEWLKSKGVMPVDEYESGSSDLGPAPYALAPHGTLDDQIDLSFSEADIRTLSKERRRLARIAARSERSARVSDRHALSGESREQKRAEKKEAAQTLKAMRSMARAERNSVRAGAKMEKQRLNETKQRRKAAERLSVVSADVTRREGRSFRTTMRRARKLGIVVPGSSEPSPTTPNYLWDETIGKIRYVGPTSPVEADAELVGAVEAIQLPTQFDWRRAGLPEPLPQLQR